MPRKTIAVDIDDVLSKSAEGFIAFSNQRWGLKLKPEDYQEEWAVVWGVPLEEAVKRAEEFHAAGVVGKYEPHEAALPALKKLAKRYNLVAVTSRRSVLKPETDAWMDRHFPGIFQSLHYAGIWDSSTTKNVLHKLNSTKAELLRELGADYLIDDQAKHCLGAAKAGITALLFGPNNHDSGQLPPKVMRARHWDEVMEFFDAQD
jgi:FMN phosphatase YigB (HAD superfamily)